MSTYLYLYIDSNFPPRHKKKRTLCTTYPDTCISKKISAYQKSDQKQKRENAEVGNYPGTYVPTLPTNTCVMIYMSLEGGERNLTFYLGYMSSNVCMYLYLTCTLRHLKRGKHCFLFFFCFSMYLYFNLELCTVPYRTYRAVSP